MLSLEVTVTHNTSKIITQTLENYICLIMCHFAKRFIRLIYCVQIDASCQSVGDIFFPFQGFAQKYPDIRMEQLINLILCRGDISRADAKQVYIYTDFQ